MIWQDGPVTVHIGDALSVLRELSAESVHCIVTSPPYWGLRDYGTAQWEGGQAACDHMQNNWSVRGSSTLNAKPTDPAAQAKRTPYKDVCGKCGARRIDSQLGLEATPEEYIARMVEVFKEVRRVLRSDGTLWLNMGDSYAGSWGAQGHRETPAVLSRNSIRNHPKRASHTGTIREDGLKPKDLCGIPWRLAFALQADGWWLRSDIIWSKPNPMPESVTDRPTKSHEYVFLLTKQARYFYDAEAVREPAADSMQDRAYLGKRPISERHEFMQAHGMHGKSDSLRVYDRAARNLRSVWMINYNDVEWIGAIGFCRKCNGLRVAGNGSVLTTSKAMDDSLRNMEPVQESFEHIESLTSSSWGQSPMDSQSIISAETEAVSTPNILKQSPCESISSEEIPPPLETQLKHDAFGDTSTRKQTLIDALTAGGNAVCVCETQPGSDGRPSDVWQIATQPYPEAHFATFPEELARRCIAAGTAEDGTVLDPFAGSGTTLAVARRMGRRAIGIELQPSYLPLIQKRVSEAALPLLEAIGE